MKKIFSIILVFALSFLHAQSVKSPSNALEVNFKLVNNGQPSYTVNYNGKPVIVESTLGIKLKDKTALDANFEIQSSKADTFNESWKPVLGEKASIVNHYNELTIALVQKETNVKMNVIFKVYNEGVAFRYEFPKQEKLNYLIISN